MKSLKYSYPPHRIHALCITLVFFSSFFFSHQIGAAFSTTIAPSDKLEDTKFTNTSASQDTSNTTSSGQASIRLRTVDIKECVDYDKGRREITILCNLTLPDIDIALNNDKVIRKEPTEAGGWFLNSSITVPKNTILTINDTWLKIESYYPPAVEKEDIHPHRINVYGALDVDNAAITSWNSSTHNYERQYHDGRIPRPYIIVRENASAASITNSELAYLGYNNSRSQGLN